MCWLSLPVSPLPTGLRLVHWLQPGGRHGPGGLAVRSWLPRVRKLLCCHSPGSSPHSFSFLLCTLTPSARDTTLPHFPLFVGMLRFAGREGSKVNLANVTWRILNQQLCLVGRWRQCSQAGTDTGDALKSSWPLFKSVLVGPTTGTRQWKILSDGGAGPGEEPQYK